MAFDLYADMSSQEQVMMQWLKTALFDAPVPQQPITDEVFRELQHQTVQLLLADYLSKHLAAQTTLIFVHNVQLLHEQDQLLKLLDREGIPAVILKGATNAINYPQPLYRISGDIDLWVGEKNFLRAYHVLMDAGYKPDEHAGLLEDVDTLNNKHVGFLTNGISIELHHRPFRVKNDAGRAFESAIMNCMEEGLIHRQMVSLDEYTFPMLPPAQNALELLIHTLTHFRGGGVGLRHILDWMMFAYKYLTDDQYKQVSDTLRTFGLEQFAIILTRMCQLYLGMPEKEYAWAQAADEKTCAALMKRILSFGNFGRKGTPTSGSRAMGRSPRKFLVMLQRGGMYNYEAQIKQHHWIKHIAWLLQLGRYIGYVVKNRKTLTADYKEAKLMRGLMGELEVFKE